MARQLTGTLSGTSMMIMVFTFIIKLSLSHALLYSFIFFKNVILILRKHGRKCYIYSKYTSVTKRKHFRENWLLYLGIWGEAGLFLGIWRAKAKYFREPRKLFQGFWDINALFSGIKGAQTPLGPHSRHLSKSFNIDQQCLR